MAIIGHQTARARLERMRGSERMPQSFIFSGPPEIGKFLVAIEWAKASAQAPNVPIQPDIIVVEPVRETKKGVTREKDIPVGRIREALGELSYLPSGGGRRTLIIRDAHRLTEKAQNALLKILEEPAPHMVIILVTHAMGRMLPTLLSRCHIVAFSPVLAAGMIESGLAIDGLPEELVLLGRPGLCMRYREHPEWFSEEMGLFTSLSRLGDASTKERLVLAEVLSQDVGRALRLVDWWIFLLRRQAIDTSSDGMFLSIGMIREMMCLLEEGQGSARLLLDTLFLSL